MATKLNIGETSWQMNKSVVDRNRHMLENELATDVTFKVSATPKDEPKIIRAHKYMLISASPVFWSMFCGELREYDDVIVCNVDAEAFNEMLKFIYTEEATITGHNVMHVLNAAKKYQLPPLAGKCADFLDKELDASNACSILEHSRFFNEENLVKKCIEIIERDTKVALQSDDFMEISRVTLCQILDNDHLDISEIAIFESGLKWATHHSDGKQSNRDTLGDALFKIRFPTMSPADFTDKVCRQELLTNLEQLEIFKYLNSAEKTEKKTSFPWKSRQKKMESKPVPLFPIGSIVWMSKLGRKGEIQSYNANERTYVIYPIGCSVAHLTRECDIAQLSE